MGRPHWPWPPGSSARRCWRPGPSSVCSRAVRRCGVQCVSCSSGTAQPASPTCWDHCSAAHEAQQLTDSAHIAWAYLHVPIMCSMGEVKLQWPARPHAVALARVEGVPVLDVVVPVYNEERVLDPSIRRLHGYLREHFPFRVRITIADNGSVDATTRIVAELAEQLDGVRVLR